MDWFRVFKQPAKLVGNHRIVSTLHLECAQSEARSRRTSSCRKRGKLHTTTEIVATRLNRRWKGTLHPASTVADQRCSKGRIRCTRVTTWYLKHLVLALPMPASKPTNLTVPALQAIRLTYNSHCSNKTHHNRIRVQRTPRLWSPEMTSWSNTFHVSSKHSIASRRILCSMFKLTAWRSSSRTMSGICLTCKRRRQATVRVRCRTGLTIASAKWLTAEEDWSNICLRKKINWTNLNLSTQ